MQAELYQLHRFTGMRIDSLRKSVAKKLRIEEARDFTRYVRNAQIIRVLKQGMDDKSPYQMDVPHLEWKITELERELNPSLV
jgi:hypothetical protein